MPRFKELHYRDCPWCGATTVAMKLVYSSNRVEGASGNKSWGVLACPRCANLVMLEVRLSNNTGSTSGISAKHEAHLLNQVPEDRQLQYRVDHLPDDVAKHFADAQRVMSAGVPDAAAVQLRRTLEAAAAHKEIKKDRLVDSIQELIRQQFVTKDFEGLLHHIRKIGNIGAHYNDETISDDEVHRVMRFTTQILRNLFEVPGELDALAAENGQV